MPKRSCPWADDAASSSSDDAAVCPLIARIPKVGRTGDMVKDQERTTLRAAFTNIIEQLWKHPHTIIDTQGFIQEKLRVLEAKGDIHAEWEQLTSFGALAKHDANWVANLVSKHSGIPRS